MPDVAKIVNNFKKRYGKNWKDRYFAWVNDNPEQAKKALATARKHGDKIIKSLAGSKAKSAKRAKTYILKRGGKVIYSTKKASKK